MKTAFVFSGQGAQFVGMGKDLYDSNPAAKAVFDSADEILGWEISDICFNGPTEKLISTRYCQPAIYTMSMACMAAFKYENEGVEPMGVGGLSLGEYAALVAAEVMTFQDGLKLLVERAKLMDEACQQTVGAMASVLGGDNAVIEEVCASLGVDVANYNCPGQTVISGEKNAVEQAVVALKAKGMRKVIALNVAGAFHSRLMASAGEKLANVLKDIKLTPATCLVTQNVVGGTVSDIESIRVNLAKQVAGSVRWESCVRALIAAGAERIIEFGPGNVLTGLLKRTDTTVVGMNVGKVEDLSLFNA